MCICTHTHTYSVEATTENEMRNSFPHPDIKFFKIRCFNQLRVSVSRTAFYLLKAYKKHFSAVSF